MFDKWARICQNIFLISYPQFAQNYLLHVINLFFSFLLPQDTRTHFHPYTISIPFSLPYSPLNLIFILNIIFHPIFHLSSTNLKFQNYFSISDKTFKTKYQAKKKNSFVLTSRHILFELSFSEHWKVIISSVSLIRSENSTLSFFLIYLISLLLILFEILSWEEFEREILYCLQSEKIEERDIILFAEWEDWRVWKRDIILFAEWVD